MAIVTIKQLLAKGVNRSNILFFNFDDERIKWDGSNLDTIITAYRELYPETPLRETHIFFDEIQMASDWQSFVRRIYEDECRNIYITGSNSQMLSSELATSLRGRSLQYEVFPLSFDEMCRFRNVDTNVYSAASRARLTAHFDEYLMWGGFPEVVMDGVRVELAQAGQRAPGDVAPRVHEEGGLPAALEREGAEL